MAVHEPSPAQGINDVPNCACQIDDADSKTKWMQHMPPSPFTKRIAAEKRPEKLDAQTLRASVGSIIHSLVEAIQCWLLSCTNGCSARHGLPRSCGSAPLTMACLISPSRTVSVLTLSSN